jgi:hypothetical protein
MRLCGKRCEKLERHPTLFLGELRLSDELRSTTEESKLSVPSFESDCRRACGIHYYNCVYNIHSALLTFVKKTCIQNQTFAFYIVDRLAADSVLVLGKYCSDAPALTPKNDETAETEKATFLVVKRVREAILDEVFKPGDHLGEAELAEKFEVSRSPVREALLAVEKEGTVIVNPTGARLRNRLFAEEILDIAELRLALIPLALKPAHRHLSPDHRCA